MKHSGWLLAIVLLAACTFTPQRVTLAPEVNFPRENIGGAAPVTVQVIDARPREQLVMAGYWGNPEKPNQHAPVVVVVDGSALHAAVEEGLRRKGFTPGASGTPLVVELRQLAYANDYRFWTIGLHTAATLHAQAGSYGRDYAVQLEKRSMIAPWPDRNAEWLKRACDDAIAQMFSDPALLRALAGK